MKKNNVKIIIASLLLATVAAGSAIIITACTKTGAQEIPTQATVVTETSTRKATVAPTEKETQKPTQAPTEKATQKPTQTPTQKPTQAPTQKPTQAPTEKPSERPTEAPTAEPTEAPETEPTEIRGDSTYDVLAGVITNSGAKGYTVVQLDGVEGKVLVLSFGKSEADSKLKIYRIGDRELTSLGKIGCSHSLLYTDENDNLCLYKAHMNAYSYGSVIVDEYSKLTVDTVREGVIVQGEDYPAVPGDQIKLFSITDLSGISDFQN